ncbi:MAG: NAD(P)H-dependent flavin oxidoreductase [Candidatus Jordarchaeum sp.]|uniref:NAD(P)H-dependent flavin oxidoreductase n=1 Tax=Candidatus Jordarchaeum sp. TaxID=2823881 RepID=UPI00404B607E
MNWRTRLTELLDCKYPIMEGAFAGIGTWEFAAAVSKTGAVGCLTASTSKTPEGLREEIQKLRKATKNPFTVNISIGLCPHIDGMFEACFEEDVPAIETAGFRPDEYAERINESGITWIHKGATVEFCKHAEKLGADAVVLVGLDGYGFKNIKQLPTFTSIAWAAPQLNVPIIAAGGIGDPRTFLGALFLGADGIYLGTALMATKECPLSDKIKENIVKAQPNHPDLIRELLAPPIPKDFAEVLKKRDTVSLEEWLISMEKVMLKHPDWKDVDPTYIQQLLIGRGSEIVELFPSLGTRPKGPFSFACGYIDRIITVKELIENLVKGAEEILKRKSEEWELP